MQISADGESGLLELMDTYQAGIAVKTLGGAKMLINAYRDGVTWDWCLPGFIAMDSVAELLTRIIPITNIKHRLAGDKLLESLVS
jgi:hypothetical protein